MPLPHLDEYVQAFLTSMRAQPKETTMFTPAGRSTIHAIGERVLLGPRGEKIRVLEHPEGGTQVEQDDKLHAVARVPLIRIVVSRKYREVVSVG